MAGGALLSAVLQTNCTDDSEDEGLCEALNGASGVAIGFPMGAIVGAGLSVSYSDTDKATTLTTSFEF